MTIGRLHHVVLDTPEPRALARFYSAVLDQPVTFESDDWVVVAISGQASGLAFQLAPGHVPPEWPREERPQQFHLDIMVDDQDISAAAVEALGARRLNRGSSPPIYADPSGHPFCLINRPEWAPPLNDAPEVTTSD